MVLTILLFIVILGLLVFVHEFGHFIAARRMGMGVEEFGFGFPPRLFGFQLFKSKHPINKTRHEDVSIDITDVKLNNGQEVIRETITDRVEKTEELAPTKRWHWIFGRKGKAHAHHTIYSINAIPIGGFVKIKGEQGDHADDTDSFASKKVWRRGLVLSSGVAMNFLLAILIISIGFAIGLPSEIDTAPAHAHITNQHIQITKVETGSPADTAGIQPGDMIMSIDGQNIVSITSFQNFIKSHNSQPLPLVIKRGTNEQTKTVTPIDSDNSGTPRIGTWLASTALISYPWYFALWMGAKTTVLLTWQIIVGLVLIIKDLAVSQHVTADVAGPIGIAVLTGQVVKMGFIYILQFTALLSINLAIINFIPFPALDGGRVLFLLIEKIRGKPVNQKVEAIIHNVGFLILIGLVVLVTFHDITRLSSGVKGFLGN